MDNLQSITYQTFEQDPVKYRNYEEVSRCAETPSRNICAHAWNSQAIFFALSEWPTPGKVYVLVASVTRALANPDTGVGPYAWPVPAVGPSSRGP